MPQVLPNSIRAKLPDANGKFRNHAQHTQRLEARLYVLFNNVSFHGDLRTRLVHIPYCYATAAPVKRENRLQANPE